MEEDIQKTARLVYVFRKGSRLGEHHVRPNPSYPAEE